VSEAATTLSLDEVEAISRRMLVASGASELQAGATARSIREAEADGIRNVGLAYLPTYCDHLACGKVRGDAVPTLAQPRPAVVVVDAHLGFAHPAFEAGEAALAAAARSNGIALLAVRHSYSAGVLGWFVERLARRGLVALMFANASATMAPHGGRRPWFGTNPIAWAAPRSGAEPVVADMSSSTVAWVNVRDAAERGETIPLGWALDPDGNPTTDPSAGLRGSMAPAAGHKGYVLALLVDLLAGGVTGSQFSHEAGSFAGTDPEPPDVGQVVMAIDPAAAAGEVALERFDHEFAALAAEPGVRLPGDRRLAHRAKAAAAGVEVPEELMAVLRQYSQHGSPARRSA
jgi:(2R)-3-sulfolactate dehydrogenase (NADP+)